MKNLVENQNIQIKELAPLELEISNLLNKYKKEDF